ncbi:MAG TPA: 2-hydroxyacid dehydrogenase, partial [Pilimelia sp.]|nr:2-hydroxyacid dehydrogenase [Pilimelia sp.]
RSLPDLRVVQLLTAGADAWIGRLPPGVVLCDARGVHDAPTADWAVTAILASLRRFDHFARAQGARRWAFRDFAPTDELTGKRVLVVGAGAIGTKIGARLAAFETTVTYVARRARPGVQGVDALPGLLPRHDVVVLVVPLTAATRGLVDDAFLAAMPDGALLVNAARGPVVDTAALTRAVGGGRLSAALDVTDPEPLPEAHPLWSMPNVLLTPHVAGSVHGMRRRAFAMVGEQLRRYVAGAPLDNVVDGDY